MRGDSLSNGLPELLLELAETRLAALESALAGLAEDQRERVRAGLLRPVVCSDFLAEQLNRSPGLLQQLLDQEVLDRAAAPGEIASRISDAVSVTEAETSFMRALREARNQEMVRIAWRDLADLADLDETLNDLSVLADTCIQLALQWSVHSLAARFGSPLDELGNAIDMGVLAMGKLGGGELNFSSDVDLIFLYPDAGETSGPRAISNEEYFRQVATRVVTVLNKVTADGFVFRVDVRLRPFGDAGPLAVSLPALETYLSQHGRDWERYAYIKARVVNQWSETSYLSENLLRPFIYRRYLDYGVFSSLREMKALIEQEGLRREYQANVKLGPGGIREIEFIVQSFQLIRGGSVAALRERRIMLALPELANQGVLPGHVSEELLGAYRFLRRLENRLQAVADQQTHDLPDKEEDRARIALAMGESSWSSLEQQLARHRQRVAEHFQSIVFKGEEETRSAGQANPTAVSIWDGEGEPAERIELLAELGFDSPGEALDRISAYREGGRYRRLDEHGRQRLDQLMPGIIATAAQQRAKNRALAGSIQIIEAIAGRSAYFSLLNENPTALQRLVGLCSNSDFLAAQLARHPLLLDELLDPRIFLDAPGRDELAADLGRRLAGVDPDDAETCLEAIRNFQQAAVFRIGVADLSHTLPLMKVSDRLTDVAELVLQAALDLARRELARSYGVPRCRIDGEMREARVAVVGYGKLGGLELGYGSDLDVVFLHDSDGDQQQTDGQRILDNAVFFARLTRRVIQYLTMQTTSGPLYEVDTRLRPSGKSGLLITSIRAFEQYQRNEAWTWEHQALLRSRAVAGDRELCSAFEGLRLRSLEDYVRRDTLSKEVMDMRSRMRSELCRGEAGEFDIKQGIGGIADIEFIVQYLALREAKDHPYVIHWSDNIRQLEALQKEEIIGTQDARELTDIYRSYRERTHRLALAGELPVVKEAEFSEARKTVTDIWGRVFPVQGTNE